MVTLVFVLVLIAGFFLLAIGGFALFRLHADEPAGDSEAENTNIGWGKLNVSTQNEAIAVMTLGVILFLGALSGVVVS